MADQENQHVFGRYNATDRFAAEIVGNGSENSRSNARTLDWSGNESLAGTLRIGSTSTGGALLKYESGSLKVSFDDGTTWQTVTLS